MATVPYITPEEYLEAEREAEYKSEYYDGQVYSLRELSTALKGRCEVT